MENDRRNMVVDLPLHARSVCGPMSGEGTGSLGPSGGFYCADAGYRRCIHQVGLGTTNGIRRSRLTRCVVAPCGFTAVFSINLAERAVVSNRDETVTCPVAKNCMKLAFVHYSPLRFGRQESAACSSRTRQQGQVSSCFLLRGSHVLSLYRGS